MIKYWSLKLKDGEFLRCDRCRLLIEGNTEANVKTYFSEAIRSDNEVGFIYCEKCYSEIQDLINDE